MSQHIDITGNDTREDIVAAANKRFRHYGYPKTTIAEIACDCNMSAGNIYRFFKSKVDIAAELARRETLEAAKKLDGILQCPYRSSRQRLEDLIFADFRNTYNLLEHSPKVLELAQHVMQHRPDFQRQSMHRERRAIQKVILEGVKSGEFEVGTVRDATNAVYNATLKYRYPQMFTNRARPELERELAHLLTLIMRGLLTDADKGKITPTQIPPSL